ncbi:hypothetical protein C5F49_04675 [Nitrosopumilus oxyclinae]|uniref:Uncharacterized protein n=1 Tax=Nitrosopumilus oxyclinae TaxID=1959104 RepID=A0A7D5M3Y2_9ARCH|nr:hypothetical protein [Nitrosopumilus oxyclinae]QLH05571.1 hypothetical protein C5F49_04675 [Nitrosopumilus oxyclinae]
MEEESNPIKDYLFNYIESSEIIPKLIVEKKFEQIIDDIAMNCYDHILTMGVKDEVVGVLATGLLHYLLTNALITSQRKVTYNDTELDIVIPNTKTLEKDPKKTLLVYIPKSSNVEIINEKIASLEKIQPEKENIWLVLSENIPTNKKTFVLSKEENSFSKIIFEIAQFSNVHGTSKFKILRI